MENKRNPDSINRHYRKSDLNRWNDLDFVVGIEIRLSNNPSKDCEMCKELCGIYPKGFNWSGWHDKCKCFLIPITMSPEEADEDSYNKLRAAFKGEEHKNIKSENSVEYVPTHFINWYARNVQKMLDADSFPDFIALNIDLIRESVNHYKDSSST